MATAYPKGHTMTDSDTKGEVRVVGGRRFEFRRELPPELHQGLQTARSRLPRHVTLDRISRFTGISRRLLANLFDYGDRVPSKRTVEALVGAGVLDPVLDRDTIEGLKAIARP